MADYQNNICVLSVGGINAKTLGATTLAVVENGTQRFFPIFVVVSCESATSITVGPAVSIGTNSTAFDNIAGISTYSNIIAANNYSLSFVSANGGTNSSIAANTSISAKVTTAATGTSQTIRVDLIGYYV